MDVELEGRYGSWPCDVAYVGDEGERRIYIGTPVGRLSTYVHTLTSAASEDNAFETSATE